MDKKFTLKEVEVLVGQVMKIESPLGQKIIAEFKNTPPDVEAKKIVDNINRHRFESSGWVHGVSGEISLMIDERIHNQAMKSYDKEYGVSDYDSILDRETFENGYRIGMGAVTLSSIL